MTPPRAVLSVTYDAEWNEYRTCELCGHEFVSLPPTQLPRHETDPRAHFVVVHEFPRCEAVLDLPRDPDHGVRCYLPAGHEDGRRKWHYADSIKGIGRAWSEP